MHLHLNTLRAASDSLRPPEQLGVVPNAHGSAVVTCGGTRVVVGVKAEFAEMSRAAPRKGRIEAAVTCSSTASTLFEGRAGEEVSEELSFVLNRMLSDGLGVSPPPFCCAAIGLSALETGLQPGGCVSRVQQQRRTTQA